MKFFKDMKNKIIKQVDDKNQNAPQTQHDKSTKNEQQKEINLKSMAKSIFNRFRDPPKTAQVVPDANKQIISELVKNQGVFWRVAPIQPTVTVDKQTTKIQVNKNEQNKANLNQNQIDAEMFVSNICAYASQLQLNEKRKVKKARDVIFNTIQIQPIYMLEDSIAKILKLQFDLDQAEMIQRSQVLVNEKNSIDRAIQNVLISGYLWQANSMQDRDFIDACFQTVHRNINSIVVLHDRIKQIRANFSLFVSYFRKIKLLNHKRTIIVKKLKVLNKIKPYKKDIDMKFANIDQAFYIQRNRQKLYAHFMNESTFTEKVLLFQNILKVISNQNKNLVSLVQSELYNWIDKNQKLESKHVQKLLILLYFTKYEKMYIDNKMFVNLGQIKNKNKFIEQINTVKSWKDYKYVNDPGVKSRVTRYLDDLILWLNRQQERERKRETKVNEEEAQNIRKIKQNKDKSQTGIKLSKHVKQEQQNLQKYQIDNKKKQKNRQKNNDVVKQKQKQRHRQKQDKRREKKQTEDKILKMQKQSYNGNNIQIIVFDEMHKAKQKLQSSIKF